MSAPAIAPAQAEQFLTLAREHYADHPAALPLLIAAVHGETEAEKTRAWFALNALDPLVPIRDVIARASHPDHPDAEKAPEGPRTIGRISLLSLGELVSLPLPIWRIYGLLTGITLLWAGPGSFKTFLAIAWAVCIATGRPWCGRAVKQGTVVFIVGEGAVRAFYLRVYAAAAALGVPPEDVHALPIYVTAGPVNLGRWDGLQAQELFEAAGRVADSVGPIAVLIPDTLSRCVPGEENKQEIMQGFIGTCDEARRVLGCDVATLHHANADGGRPRGSTVLEGAADGALQLVPGAPDSEGNVPLSLYALKLKEAESGPGRDPVARLLAVKTVIVGPDGSPLRDEMGFPRTTRVIREASPEDVTAEASADQALLDAIGSDGISASKLCGVLGKGKGTVLRDLARLHARGMVHQTGTGKASRWVRG